jgi:hypothetical protein
MMRSRSLLLGALVSAALALAVLPAQALSEQQLVAKLNAVPAFTIIDEKGNPLLLTPKSDKEVAYLNFYLDADLVKQAMEAFKKQNAQAAGKYRVGVTSLGQAFKVATEQQKKKDNKVRFQFLSGSQDLRSATELAKKQNPELKAFQGVPIFFASGGTKQGILTLKREGKEYLPMFFSKADLDRNLDELKKSRKDLPSALNVQVATLDSVVGTILGGKNDADSEKITFLPSRAALQYAQVVQKNNPAPAKP